MIDNAIAVIDKSFGIDTAVEEAQSATNAAHVEVESEGNGDGIVNLMGRYSDPTYMIRALPSNASDNISCTLLAQSAVHGAMAGYTGFTVGPVNSRRAYIPIARGTEAQNTVKLTEDVGQTACFYKSA